MKRPKENQREKKTNLKRKKRSKGIESSRNQAGEPE